MVFRFACFVQKQTDEDEYEVGSDVSATVSAASGYSCDITASVSTSSIIQQVEKCKERSGAVCVGSGKQVDVIIFTERLLTRLYA